MMTPTHTAMSRSPHRHRGSTLLEVLITIIVLVFGVMGYVGMQTRMAAANVEAYGRSQAIVLLSDMVGRIDANRANVASYVGTYGTAAAEDCTAKAIGAARDTCEWNKALQGTAETSGTRNVGAMMGARGCVELIQPADTATSCKPAIYRVSVGWQGMHQTKVPSINCGGTDPTRRVIAERIAIGAPTSTCS